MPKSYWLLKTDADTYAWDAMLADGRTYWDGVRNYQARNNMRAMKKGDRALFYHSVGDKTVVGVVEIVGEHYQDPTTDDDRWSVVDVAPIQELKRPVSLAEIKSNPDLAEIALVRQSRLSVMPLEKDHYDTVLKMGGGTKRVAAAKAKGKRT